MSTIWEVDDADEEIEGLDAAGRADPAYAAALGLIRAPFGRRFLAVTIDFVVYLLVQIPFWVFTFPLLLMFARSEITLYGLVAHPNFFIAALMAGITTLLTWALLIVQGVFQGRMGFTIGKLMCGIRAINVERLARPGFWRIVLRTLIVYASNIVPVVGPALMFSSALSDRERRGRAWHDHASHVWLVDVKNGLDPYDGKRMRIARKVVKVDIAPQAAALPSLATAEDRGAQPEYRPAHSVSAGVLGVAKPRRTGREDAVGIVDRPGSEQLLTGAPPARGPQDHRVVLGVPADIAASSAAQPPKNAVPQDPQSPMRPAPMQPAPAQSVPQHLASGHPVAPAPEHAESVSHVTPAARLAVRLTLDSGGEFVLVEPTIFGRHPENDASYGPAQCVPVPDQTRSVSKTHFALRLVAGGIEVRDLGSTNGTFIRRAGAETQVAPETPLTAALGDVVRFGDRLITIGEV